MATPSNTSYIAYAGRTAIGKFNGKLASVPAPRLGAALVKDALQKTGVALEAVDEILMGQVLTAGVGQAPARQTALYGGLPHSVCATTVGRVCGSGIKSVMLADQAIRLGDASLVFAGGQENMSMAPHILMGSRMGFRFGSTEMKDSMQHDGLWDVYNNVPMGNCGEICANEFKFSRQQQDEYALTSYKRARLAVESGLFADEIIPVEVPDRKGSFTFEVDEEPFSVDLDRITSLRPAFAKDGSVTAANASSINDGAALLVLASEQMVKEQNLTPIAKIVAQASYAHDPAHFTTAPIDCIKKLLHKANLNKDDIDLYEINEAFSVVSMAAIHALELDLDRVNVNGGAVSLGHPIGCSGTRILVTLIHALKKRGLKRGLATLCIGGGEASGVIVETVS
jgi:acetyl-CoA C-acetyltransferase